MFGAASRNVAAPALEIHVMRKGFAVLAFGLLLALPVCAAHADDAAPAAGGSFVDGLMAWVAELFDGRNDTADDEIGPFILPGG